jgi:hypothetical protein
MPSRSLLLRKRKASLLRKGIPDPETVGRCDVCGKSVGGKSYYGPECQCHEPKGNALKGAHSIGTLR